MENKEFLATEPVGRLLRKLAVPAVVFTATMGAPGRADLFTPT